MYAIIETGGKQYRVAEKEKITVEKIEAQSGSQVELDRVLLIADQDQLTVGAPLVSGAKVTATVLAQEKGQKVKVVKFKRRKGFRRVQGHRQNLTTLRIEKISAA